MPIPLLAVTGLLKAVPISVYAVVALTIGGGAYILYQRGEIANAQKATATVKAEFGTYREQVTEKARRAEVERRNVELQGFRNAERVSDEQNRRDKAYNADRASLLGTIERLRQQADVFSAGIARDTASGDLARVAARATLATELFQSCQGEYGSLAAEAERVRVQAVGLYDYIRGNQQCSTPFGLPAVALP